MSLTGADIVARASFDRIEKLEAALRELVACCHLQSMSSRMMRAVDAGQVLLSEPATETKGESDG